MNMRAVVHKDCIVIGAMEDRWNILFKIFREEWGDYSVLFCSKESYSLFADSHELLNIIRSMENSNIIDIGNALSKIGYDVEFKV